MRIHGAMLASVLVLAVACSPDAGDAPRPATPTTETSSPAGSPSPAAAPTPRPDMVVAITADHRLVVVDLETGETVRVLATGDDPDDFGGEGEEPFAAGSFLDSAAVRWEDGTVWFSTCCEPAPGSLHVVSLDGGESRSIGVGYEPMLDPSGTRVLVVEMQWLTVLTPQGDTAHRIDGDEPVQIAEPAWAPDGRSIVFERRVEPETGPELRLIAADARDMDEARVLPMSDGVGPWHAPIIGADGLLRVIEHTPRRGESAPAPGAARLTVDPKTGEVLERRQLPADAVDHAFDRTGTHLLTVLSDGRLLWESGEDSGELAGPFVAAAW